MVRSTRVFSRFFGFSFCFDDTGCTFAAPDTQDESYLNVIVSLSSGLL